MEPQLAARLAVLLASAVAAGALYVRLARSTQPSSRGDPSPLRGVPGAVNAALGAFVIVAGGAALTGFGLDVGPDAGFAVLRVGGLVLLAAAGLLAAAALAGRGPLGPSGLVGLAWLGAGMALAAPIVLLVAAATVVLLGVRVEDRSRP
jgi:hypothetical protein